MHRRKKGIGINKLQASLKDDTTNIKRTVNRQTKCQPFAKLKELQADTQANAFAAHLILPKRTHQQTDGEVTIYRYLNLTVQSYKTKRK